MSGTQPERPIDCSCHRAIQLLQEKWVLHIVRALLPGPRGFNEVGREAGGCNPSTLAQRLARLEQAGLVSKRCDADGSRSLYELTASGKDLSEVVYAIEAWASRHLVADDTVSQEAPAAQASAPAASRPRARLRAVDEDAPSVPTPTVRRRDARETREGVVALSAAPMSDGA